MENSELRELQLEELKILEEFIRICEKHRYRYYMLGGTLLGAIRHKGFIPWDDDVDMTMPRSDYEKLLKLPESEYNSEFKLVTYENNEKYRYPWARIESENIKIINHSANIPREENAWIDIIPLDGFPDSKVKKFFHKIHLSFWWDLNQIVQYDELVDQKRRRSFLGKIAVKIAGAFKWIGKIIGYKTCLTHLNKILMKYPYDMESKEIINFLAAFGFDEVFTRESFAESDLYEFEGRKIKGPKGYDSVLKRIYGNYMELPPLDQRNKHHAEIVKSKENKMINFTVGPVQCNEEILELGREQIPYFRTQEFSEIMLENENLMKKFAYASDDSKVVFITGSGTASMEATVINTLNKEDKALIINGGSFGERFVKLCEIHEIPYTEIKLEKGKSLTREELYQFDGRGYTALLINVHETSTGVLYDINMISEFCKKNKIFLITDCISEFIADEFNMKELEADIMITGSQKALACPPGVSIIILSKRAIDRVYSNNPKTMYLDLKEALENQKRGQTPFTPAVGILRQINLRLKQIEENGGIEVEREKIKEIANHFRSKIKDEKLPLEFTSESMSNAVTALHPINVSAYDVFLILKNEYNIWICPNGGDLKDKIFRVGHIGNLSISDNDKLIEAFKDMQKRRML